MPNIKHKRYDWSDYVGDMGVGVLAPVFVMMSHYGGYVINAGWAKYQKVGWDVIVWTNIDRFLSVEVKAVQRSSMPSGIFEESTASGTKSGWVNTIESDLLCFVYLGNYVAYIVKFGAFKAWYDKNKTRYPVVRYPDDGSRIYSVNTRVPWEDIEDGIGKENIGRIAITDFVTIWLTLKRMKLWNYGPAHGLDAYEVLENFRESARRAIHNFKYDPESIRSQHGGLIFI